MNVDKFTGNVMAVVICILIISAVALPILGGVTIPEGIANADSIKTMLGVVPLLLIVGVVIYVIRSSISFKE